MKRKPTIKIVKDELNPEPVELLAKSIIQVSDGFQRFLDTSLNQRALIILLHDGIGASHITRKQIKLVLDNLPRLKAWYVKPSKSS